MLSRDQADRIAEKTLQDARSATPNRRPPARTHIPFLYRSAAMVALPPPIQAEVLRTARRDALRSAPFLIALFAWLALVAVVWMSVISPNRHSNWSIPFTVPIYLLPCLVQCLVTRIRVREMATQLHALALPEAR